MTYYGYSNFSYSNLSNSKKVFKYILNKDYSILNKYTIPLPVNDNSVITDIAYTPNGKIFISIQNNLTPIDSIIYVIESPNNNDDKINFSQISLYKDSNVLSKYVKLFLFPNTYGSYKRAEFSHISKCEKNSILFTNQSDTFWFKHFRFY